MTLPKIRSMIGHQLITERNEHRPHHTMTTIDQLISCLKFQPWITSEGQPFHVQTFHNPEGGYSHRVRPIGYDKSKGDTLLEGDEAERYLDMMCSLYGAHENY